MVSLFCTIFCLQDRAFLKYILFQKEIGTDTGGCMPCPGIIAARCGCFGNTPGLTSASGGGWLRYI